MANSTALVLGADGRPRRIQAGDSLVAPNLSGTNTGDAPPNIVDNPNFNVWQRGVSFAAIADGAYCADRWRYSKSGTVVHTVSQTTSVPNVSSLYALLLSATTGDSSIAAGDYCYVAQPIEGFDYQAIAAGSFTVSFWVLSNVTGTYCVAFRNSGLNRSYVAEYTISAVNTWEYKTITVPTPPTAGTWNYANGVGLWMSFALSCGSTYQTTAGAWQTGNYLGTSSQVNNTQTITNSFCLSQVQVNPGSTAAPFRSNSYASDLRKCQRYAFYVSSFPMGLAYNSNVLSSFGPLSFPTTMRDVPVLATSPAAAYGVNTGNAGTVSLYTATVTGASFVNAANDWTTTAIVTLTALLTADL